MIRLWLFFFFLFAVAVIYTAVFPGTACSDDVKGSADLEYSQTSSKTDSGNGNISRVNTDDFLQQYTLTLSKTLYPNLTLFANGIFQQDLAATSADTGDTKSRTTTFQPLIILTLNPSPFSAVATYNKLQITTNSSGSPPETVITDTYSGLFSYKADGLPELYITPQRTETYDTQRALQDTLVNRLVVNSRFVPVKNLDLSCQFTYNDTYDKIQNVDTAQISGSGRFSYSRAFFNNRVFLTSDGNVSRQETTATIGTAGSGVQFSPAAVSGLYAADSTAGSQLGVDVPPHTPANDAMISTPFLINGGDFIGNAGKLNIGFPQANPADNNPRDVGLAFAQPTEVNAIYVTVNQDVNTVAASYSWDVYTSSDINVGQGVNPTATQQWTLYQPAATFTFSEVDKTFRIVFQKVTAQFFKVVTRPLPVPASVPGVDVNNILVSQIQAFDSATSSQAGKSRTVTTTQSYDLNVRTRILDSPALFYDLSGYYSRTSNTGSGFAVGQPNQLSYIVTNGLSGAYRFNQVFSANARVAREDSNGPEGSSVAYIGNASLTAVPIRTLSDSLVFSSRQQQIGGKPNDTTSVFLTNLAELYKGLNAALSGGLSWSTSPTLQTNNSEILNFTLSAVPYSVLTINGDFSWTDSNTTGGGVPNVQTLAARSDLAFTYTPFPTLSFLGSFGVFSGVNVQQNTLTSYGVNWSPFPDGTLQFNFTYNQDLASLNSTKDTTILPNLRWNISRYTYMTISYLVFKSESVITDVHQHSNQETFSTALHVTF